MTAPVAAGVLLARPARPRAASWRDDVATLAGEYEGRFLAGLVDIDASPTIAQAMQIPSSRSCWSILDGRPAPLIPGRPAARRAAHRADQVTQQLTAQGMTGRHQPLAAAPPRRPRATSRRRPSVRRGPGRAGERDIDRAVAEYQKLVDANPADAEATAGLAMAKVLQRTQGADLAGRARAAAAADPDDVDAQTLVADLDLLGGHVDDAFNRLVDLVRRTAGDERDRARDHLIGLFAAVGNDDPRVLRGRQNLASALF